jgi:hypothetical protein
MRPLEWQAKVTVKPKKILDKLKEQDDHRLRLANHLLMITFTAILVGIATDWAFDQIALSATGPSVFQELTDFYFKA